jgi:hypothetical protein
VTNRSRLSSFPGEVTMGNRKAAHHRGTHQARARAITTAANANPHTRCWRCGRTLEAHPPHRNGRPAYWTAGHTTDGQTNGQLLPEASTCNYSAGATAGNRRRNGLHTTRTW